MDSDNIDDDLRNLLDQLDDDEPDDDEPEEDWPVKIETSLDGPCTEEVVMVDHSKKVSRHGTDQPSDIEVEPSAALRPIKQKIIRLDGTPALEESDTESEPTDVIKYLDKMDEVAEEVLIACRNDRQEAQEVINMLRGQCDDAHVKNHPPARMYVDGLVKAVEVKANINSNAVKVMEGVAKMIAATKVSNTNINNNTIVSGAELDDILSGAEPMGELD